MIVSSCQLTATGPVTSCPRGQGANGRMHDSKDGMGLPGRAPRRYVASTTQQGPYKRLNIQAVGASVVIAIGGENMDGVGIEAQ
jgi:hypothetical protein